MPAILFLGHNCINQGMDAWCRQLANRCFSKEGMRGYGMTYREFMELYCQKECNYCTGNLSRS